MHRSGKWRRHVIKALVILTAFSMLYLSISPVPIFGQVAATVSGRVVDEDGRGIGNVRIEIYSSDGALIKSLETSSDGSFIFQSKVTLARRILRFSKDGYVNVTKTLMLSEGETIELGEIVLLKAVKLTSSIRSIAASPGDKLILPFVISNIGGESETVKLITSSHEGWSTRILDQFGREIREIELSPKASLNLQLEVSVPIASAGKNNLTLTAVGRANSTIEITIEVQQLSKSILFCRFPGKAATPGDTVRFQVTLKNPFGVEMRFRLSMNSVPSNWTAHIKSAAGEYVTEVTLDSNEFVDLVIEVEPPETAKTGEEYSLKFIAESSDGSVTDSLPLSVILTEIEENIRITAKFPEVTVEAGRTLQYPIKISNLGDIDRLLLLFVKPPADWKVVFKSGTMEISRLYLEAGKSESLIVEATPPSTVNVDTYTLPIQIKSLEGAVYAEMNLTATIIGSYKIYLEPSTLLTSVTAGGSTTFTVEIINIGHTPVTSVSLDIALPEDWESSVTPVQVDSLKPRESFTFNVAINTPEDTVAGDYLITLTGLSDQVQSDEVQVRITVTAPTSWGLIGLGLAVVMIIALVLVFIKFKRR